MKIRTRNWCQICAREDKKKHFQPLQQYYCNENFKMTCYNDNWVHAHGFKSNQKWYKNNLRLFFKLFNATRKPRTCEMHFLTLFTSQGGKCSSLVCFFFIYFQPVYNLMFLLYQSAKFIFRSQHIFLNRNWKTERQNRTTQSRTCQLGKTALKENKWGQFVKWKMLYLGV